MTKVVDCCKHTKKDTKCIRKSDNKEFILPRRFSKKKCLTQKIKGFSMKSSCAPYKDCKKKTKTKTKTKNKTKTKKQFLYNPNNPKKSFDVYIDKNPKDTIPIKYTTLNDVKATIRKLERLFKKGDYTHKRIWQVGMILYVRLKVLKKHKPQHYNLAKKYFTFLSKRTKTTDKDLKKRFTLRKKLVFKLVK